MNGVYLDRNRHLGGDRRVRPETCFRPAMSGPTTLARNRLYCLGRITYTNFLGGLRRNA